MSIPCQRRIPAILLLKGSRCWSGRRHICNIRGTATMQRMATTVSMPFDTKFLFNLHEMTAISTVASKPYTPKRG